MKPKKLDNEEQVRFTMRMDKALYEELKFSASKNKRSIAKELEYATEQYLKKLI